MNSANRSGRWAKNSHSMAFAKMRQLTFFEENKDTRKEDCLAQAVFHKILSSFDLQESVAVMKAMPLTRLTDICAFAVTGGRVKGE